MAITVIGQVTKDALVFPSRGWVVSEGLGGALYTIGSIASLIDDAICPVCNVGTDIFDDVLTFLSRFKNVDTSGVRRLRDPNVHNYIIFVSEYGTQYDEHINEPIRLSQVKPFLGRSDFILVSSMTGFDMSLTTLQQIKLAASCPIYFDYHILALARDALGNRFVRRRRNWLQWCAACDHLQMNQHEAESLSGFSLGNEEKALHFVTPILDRGVRSVAITFGAKGVLAGMKVDNCEASG